MNLNHLKYFFDSARYKSLSKSAKINYVGQSAISKAIRSLEADLEVRLITHNRNRFQLTEDGEIIFKQCQDVFESIDMLKTKLNEEKGEIKGELRVACASSMARDSLSITIRQLKHKYPLLKIKLQLGRTDLVRDWIRSGSSEVGLILTHQPSNDFDYYPLSKGYFHLVKSPHYKGDWKKDGIFITEETREINILKSLHTNKYKTDLPIQMEISSWGIIKIFILDQLGAGLLPDYSMKEEIKSGVLKKLLVKDFSIPYERLIITQKGRYMNNKAKAFLEELKKNL